MFALSTLCLTAILTRFPFSKAKVALSLVAAWDLEAKFGRSRVLRQFDELAQLLAILVIF